VIVLDTTVLVYAVGGDHPLSDPCRRVIEAIGDGRLRATTTAEVIQEFTHVRARRRDRGDAARHARAYAELLSPLIIVGEDELKAGLRLFEGHEDLGAFDAVLAATTLAHDATALVSADRAFGGVSGLTHIDPAGPDLDPLLA
jgi:uncharacterized protein